MRTRKGSARDEICRHHQGRAFSTPGTVLANTHGWHGGVRPDEGATGRTLDPFLTVRGGPRLAAITVSQTTRSTFESAMVYDRQITTLPKVGSIGPGLKLT
jgi:hypothetical protein